MARDAPCRFPPVETSPLAGEISGGSEFHPRSPTVPCRGRALPTRAGGHATRLGRDGRRAEGATSAGGGDRINDRAPFATFNGAKGGTAVNRQTSLL